MIVPDVNLLLYATHDRFAEHRAAARWMKALLESEDEAVGLTHLALFAYLRLTTSPRMFKEPRTIEEAVTVVEGWLARPNVRVLSPGPEHLPIAFDLLRALRVGGNLTTDVQLAAIAIEHGAELHSNDLDFGRFPKLRFKNPLG